MLTLSLLSFVTYYIFMFVLLTILIAAINAVQNKIGLKLSAFKLKKYEWIFISIVPAVDFFVKVLLPPIPALIFCIIIFIILYVYIESKFSTRS